MRLKRYLSETGASILNKVDKLSNQSNPNDRYLNDDKGKPDIGHYNFQRLLLTNLL